MTQPSFVVRLSMNEEGPHEFVVNGTVVGHCSHDTHGWNGMEESRVMFDRIAKELGIKVQVQEVA